eukprot:CAMPEP_0181107772 /NCGR_PEP_ID=MMETSP1071-20121207/17265_1 /TAXON_ID=35127 /ORGANISM="Thalassiosira sp., Strain NH16" /LENGTH=30 /DNA_ID= /DNA_START= /DNA_END= /DNA_ORIENTATION=
MDSEMEHRSDPGKASEMALEMASDWEHRSL